MHKKIPAYEPKNYIPISDEEMQELIKAGRRFRKSVEAKIEEMRKLSPDDYKFIIR